MEQRRFSGKSHWYHETQSSTGQTQALPLVPEAARVADRFLLDLTLPEAFLDACQPWLQPARDLCERLFPRQVPVSRLRTFSAYDRLSTALTVAQVSGVQRLCNHYAARLAPLPGPDSSRESNHRLAQITQYARQLAGSPHVIDSRARQQLDDVGLTRDDIILISQIVGFVGFQARAIAAFQAMLCLPVRWLPGMEMQQDAPQTLFAKRNINWSPALEGVTLRNASAGQLEALSRWQPLAELRDLTPLLAHEPLLLNAMGAILHSDLRAALDDQILQLAALVTARINGSAHCFDQQRQHVTLNHALADAPDIQAMLRLSQPDPQMQAVIQAVQLITRAADRFSAAQFNPLIEQGLSVQQAVSLLVWSGLCGWLNRLKIALGEA